LQYFETRFLEEAEKFIAGLDPKAVRKVFIILTLLSKQTIRSFLKNYIKIFGSLEYALPENKFVCLLFGIKQMTGTLWFLRLTALLKRLIKYQLMKLKGQLTSG